MIEKVTAAGTSWDFLEHRAQVIADQKAYEPVTETRRCSRSASFPAVLRDRPRLAGEIRSESQIT
jgi:hypothetical protein